MLEIKRNECESWLFINKTEYLLALVTSSSLSGNKNYPCLIFIVRSVGNKLSEYGLN
jgi:hypothetical protein